MLKGKKRVLLVFAVIYLVFISILIYLLNFNTGLHFVKEETPKGIKLHLKNESVHLIRDVEIIDEKGEQIAFFEKLLPNEQQVINFGKKTMVKLEARAPFHIPTVVEFWVTNIPTEISLSYKTNYPLTVVKGNMFTIAVEICAKGGSVSDIGVIPEINKENIEFSGEKIYLDIGQNECKKASFQLKALKKGKTIIVFKIFALNSVKNIEAEIEII